MADFHQSGPIGTLHSLGCGRPVEELETDLRGWADARSAALIIPALASELDGPALGPMIGQLAQVEYLDRVVVGLDGADAADHCRARDFFAPLGDRVHLLWNDGPRLRSVHRDLAAAGLAPHRSGKGRNVWLCLGYITARAGRGAAVAVHDADIVSYDRSLLARLLYPVLHPTFGYHFAKGYYDRQTGGRMQGRATRLLVTPLLRALTRAIGPDDYIEYLHAFRYPLAGEVALRSDLVTEVRLTSDWGLEIGLLTEVRRHTTLRHICQVDIADAYDHKHQSGSAVDDGLGRMGVDVAEAILGQLAAGGTVFTPELLRTVEAAFRQEATDLVDHYANDAALNGLALDRNEELGHVEVFSAALAAAGRRFLDDPTDRPTLAPWSEVREVAPDVLDRLVEAVALDAADPLPSETEIRA